VTRIEIVPHRPAARLWRAGLFFPLLAIVACGGPSDGFERFPAEGTVTLDGKPLATGTINFVATQTGASSSAPIADGAFRLAATDGLSPGPYRVEVYSLRPTGKKIPSADDPGTLVDETVHAVPPQYNLNSTLTTEVPPGGPKAPLSFPLVSTPAGPTQR
jgi:hypothetical protein